MQREQRRLGGSSILIVLYVIFADAVLEPVRQPGVPAEDPGPHLQPLPGEPRLPRGHFGGENNK